LSGSEALNKKLLYIFSFFPFELPVFIYISDALPHGCATSSSNLLRALF
jgi:hypothetical protein